MRQNTMGAALLAWIHRGLRVLGREIVPLAVVMLLLGGWLAPARAQSPTGQASATIAASGTISAREVRIASELGGRVVEITVDEGDAVSAGQTLVRLDDSALRLQLTQAEAAVATARADLAAAEAGPTAEEIALARARVAVVEAEREGARRAWENAQEALENPQELEGRLIEARTAVKLSEQRVEDAEADLTLQRTLRDRDAPEGSDLRVDAAGAAVRAAQADLQRARVALYHLRQIRENPLGLRAQAHAAEGRYRMAEAGVVVARAELEDLLAGPRRVDVAVVRAAVHQAEAQVAVLRAQMRRFTVPSPLDGIVVAKTLRQGETAVPAAAILNVADLSTVELEVYVPQDKIGRVRPGQDAIVTVDSLPGQGFPAKVARIATRAEFTPRNVATVEGRRNTFYGVTLRVPNPRGQLKPGMPADAVITVGDG